MGIKDLFDKGNSLSFVKEKTQNDLHENVESPRYVEAYSKQSNRFVPSVDLRLLQILLDLGWQKNIMILPSQEYMKLIHTMARKLKN